MWGVDLTRNPRFRCTYTIFIMMTLTALFFLGSPFMTNATKIAFSPAPLEIQVDHTVEFRNGGLTIINDTIKLSAKPDEKVAPIPSFLVGFPLIYKSNLAYAYAFDTLGQRLEMELDVGLGKPGFYAVKVIFPRLINISDEAYEFTVTFVFSDLITSKVLPFEPEPGKRLIQFNATFPAAPSLNNFASAVNLTIILPDNVDFISSSFHENNVKLTNRTMGAFQIFNRTWEDMEAFVHKPSWFQFGGIQENFIILEALEIERVIKIENLKRVLLTDTYEIMPKAGNLSKLRVQLVPGAYEIKAWDSFERPFREADLKIEAGEAEEPGYVTLTFSRPYKRNKPGRFRLAYLVPWRNVIDQISWQRYSLELSMPTGFDWIVRKLVITLVLPEGAEFVGSLDAGVIQKSAFQESLTFTYYNVTPFHEIIQTAAYDYNVLWFSFRPTLWVGVAVAIIGVLILLWRAPKPAAPIPMIPVKPEELKSYVDSYEEKRRSLRMLELLEEKARKGKIPRRRYKVRKRALESRLSVLSKDLTRLREKLRTASAKYADMMRRIEIAEAELEGIEAGIRRTETRYRRGEISTAAYHKLLEDYYRRRERARTTIDGIILRLKEEIA